jgi:hypothetical protein
MEKDTNSKPTPHEKSDIGKTPPDAEPITTEKLLNHFQSSRMKRVAVAIRELLEKYPPPSNDTESK